MLILRWSQPLVSYVLPSSGHGLSSELHLSDPTNLHLTIKGRTPVNEDIARRIGINSGAQQYVTPKAVPGLDWGESIH